MGEPRLQKEQILRGEPHEDQGLSELRFSARVLRRAQWTESQHGHFAEGAHLFGIGNPTKILDNIKTSRASSAVSTPVAAPAMKQSEMRFEPRVPVGFSANLQGKCFFAQNFTRAFASSYTIPAGK